MFTNTIVQTTDGKLWNPCTTAPPSLEFAIKDRSDSLRFTLPRNDLTSDLITVLLNRGPKVKVYYGTIDVSTGEETLLWQGMVNSAELTLHTCQIEAISLIHKGLHTTPRIRLATCCIRRFGDPDCTINPDQWSAIGTVSSQFGTQLIITINEREVNTPSPIPANYFKYGKCYSSSVLMSRAIISSSAEDSGTQTLTLTLRFAFPFSVAHRQIHLIPGCDKSKDTCENRYNNLNNRLSFDHMPTQYSTITGRQGKVSGGGKK